MTRKHFIFFPFVGIALIGVAFAPADRFGWAAGQTDSAYVPLFNGKDLTGWKVFAGDIKVWGAENGLLYTAKRGGGWLMTEKEFADFDLQLEYRLPAGGNSGIALRSPLKGNPAYEGMEIQLLDDHDYARLEKRGIRPSQYTGSIYDVVGPSKHVSKPAGEWNAMRMVAQGRTIVIEQNGTKIIDANLDDYKDRLEKKVGGKEAHPGLARTKGHIGLQSYNFRVDFRNIRIKELNGKG